MFWLFSSTNCTFDDNVHDNNTPPGSGIADTIWCMILIGKNLFIHVSQPHAYDIENRSLKSFDMAFCIDFFICFTCDDRLLSSIESMPKIYKFEKGRRLTDSPRHPELNLPRLFAFRDDNKSREIYPIQVPGSLSSPFSFPMSTPIQHPDTQRLKDEEQLAGLGYKQELKRDYSPIELFGFSFGLLGKWECH